MTLRRRRKKSRLIRTQMRYKNWTWSLTLCRLIWKVWGNSMSWHVKTEIWQASSSLTVMMSCAFSMRNQIFRRTSWGQLRWTSKMLKIRSGWSRLRLQKMRGKCQWLRNNWSRCPSMLRKCLTCRHKSEMFRFNKMNCPRNWKTLRMKKDGDS